MNSIKKAEWFLVLLLILFISCFILFRNAGEKSGNYAYVTLNGICIGKYDLSSDRTIPIHSQYGSNELHIKNGNVYMSNADCPDQYCVKHHSIRKSGELIVCLPHRLIIKIIATDTPSIDGVTSLDGISQ